MRVNKIVPATIMLAQIGWAGASLAQAPAQTASPATRQMYQPGQRKGPPKETMHRNLQQMPPNIPVPIPPDAKFVTGYQSQYAGARSLTYVRMYTENPPGTLVDWYRKNLQAYGWSAKEKPASKPGTLPSLTGSKGPIFCNINFEGPIGHLGKTTALMITFNEPR